MPAPYPVWIEHSGLPRLLTEQSGGMAVWALLRTVITIECEIHSMPATIDVSLQVLADRAGFPNTDAVRETLESFRFHRLAKMFVPDTDDEQALIALSNPIPTPLTHAQVLTAHPDLYDIRRHRYCDCTDRSEWEPRNKDLQELCDLYLDVVGVGVNQFVIDRLHELQGKATMDQIRWAFNNARKNKSHDFTFIRNLAINIAKKAGNR